MIDTIHAGRVAVSHLDAFPWIPIKEISLTTKPRTAKSQGKKASGSKPSATSPKKEIKRKADWYDYPEYFDLGFQDETEKEVVFLKEAFKRFGSGPVKRILEPGVVAVGWWFDWRNLVTTLPDST